MAPAQSSGASAPDDDEDDYMNMTFLDPTPAKESSFARAQRLKKESKARGFIKSKAQLAEEEEAAREKALSTSLLDDPRSKKSKGLAMMAKMGFSGGGLGKKTEDGKATGRVEPVMVGVKEDRGGIGLENEKKRKMREAAEAAEERGIKTVKLDPDEYRERVRKEAEESRLEKQFYAAQRLAERLDEEKSSSMTDATCRPLKTIDVLYRGLVRYRAEQERDRRMRHDLEQSLSRLPTYEDDAEDEDDKQAMGKKETVYTTVEDLDDEDEELDDFNALEIGERLRRVLDHFRTRHNYCFWCKTAYPDAEMEGCPGFSEEEHD